MTATLDTGTDDLLAQRCGPEDRIALITLNRPARRNALSLSMLTALAEVLDRCAQEPEIRSIVLTGAGSAFCAGGDVKNMAQAPRDGSGSSFEARLARQRTSQRDTVARIYRMPKPMIAALPGAAAGAGFGLCMACDLRIAADTALMTTAFARVGLSGDYGLPWLLTRQVGRARALELFYLSERLSAQRCLELGLVNRVVPAAELQAAALTLAADLASGPSIAQGYIKENINAAFESELESFMDAEVTRNLTAMGTEDHAEAARAFVERRLPSFKGR